MSRRWRAKTRSSLYFVRPEIDPAYVCTVYGNIIARVSTRVNLCTRYDDFQIDIEKQQIFDKLESVSVNKSYRNTSDFTSLELDNTNDSLLILLMYLDYLKYTRIYNIFPKKFLNFK